ncbi:GNAT family N-acetyltransferase [Segetibacter koreensis]|uniref:GNAT family N-acetyltransferase n=1 Tax=Segetibacter koreensis TaxID=398037 RepID=UPI0003675A78|nr:GNAT family N-acetyltransferase [Segetibacter koreensis]
MKLSDINDAMKLSTSEGWNQTENDWRLLIENAENVCLLAEIDRKVIGTTTAINYSSKVAWVGMVLVNEAYRGLGVAKLLLTAVLKKVKFCRSVKLDATPVGKQVYQKFGFKDEYSIARMVNTSMTTMLIDDYEVVPDAIQLKHIPEIVSFDKFIFGTSRQQLIEFLIKQNPGKGWFLRRNNLVAGFVLGRDGSKYHQIGPVAAVTTNDAKILITKALESLRNQPVVVDVLCDKEDMINWLHSIGFIKQRHFIRMYKDENYCPGTIDKQYMICGPEFG